MRVVRVFSGMKLFKLLNVGLLVLLVACSQGKDYTVAMLPNGKEVKIVRVTKAVFSESESALILVYETDLRLEDVESLRKEVLEIWPKFQIDVEQAGLNAAVIQARKTTKSSIFMSTSNNYGFVFTKKASGDWILNEK